MEVLASVHVEHVGQVWLMICTGKTVNCSQCKDLFINLTCSNAVVSLVTCHIRKSLFMNLYNNGIVLIMCVCLFVTY